MTQKLTAHISASNQSLENCTFCSFSSNKTISRRTSTSSILEYYGEYE